MKTKYGFTKMSILEFKSWIQELRIGRTILNIQQHHTYIPSYQHFDGENHFELQKGMSDYHTINNGWMDIGQHFSIFPDGTTLTGRSLEYNPAGIYRNNRNAICIENLGHFDEGKDRMTDDQKEAIIEITAILCKKFNLPINTNAIVYHHWFNFDGDRNNGAGGNKSCPGETFFGGHKVEDCESNFLPLINQKLVNYDPSLSDTHILKYAMVTASRLNVRIGSHYSHPKAADREALRLGAIVRVYQEEHNWYKISKSSDHWISSRYTEEVKRYVVTATTLNVRSGPGIHFSKIGQVYKDDQVFIAEQTDQWAKIALEDKWVHQNFIKRF